MAKPVYVAGPLFSEAERLFLERMVDSLSAASGLDPVADFFLPHRDVGEVGNEQRPGDVFGLDMRRLDESSIVVGLLDGQDSDSGTCIELGYAYASGKKILGLLTDYRAGPTDGPALHRPNLMVWGVCEQGTTLFHDLGSLAAAFSEHAARSGLKVSA